MAFNGSLNAARAWLLVWATINYGLSTSCINLKADFFFFSSHSTRTPTTFSVCVWVLGENKRIICCGKKVTQCINLQGCSSPPNEVCEESLLITYRGWGRCLSFFIRKKGFLPSHNCQWLRWCWWGTRLSLHGPIYTKESRRLKERGASLCRVVPLNPPYVRFSALPLGEVLMIIHGNVRH